MRRGMGAGQCSRAFSPPSVASRVELQEPAYLAFIARNVVMGAGDQKVWKTGCRQGEGPVTEPAWEDTILGCVHLFASVPTLLQSDFRQLAFAYATLIREEVIGERHPFKCILA